MSDIQTPHPLVEEFEAQEHLYRQLERALRPLIARLAEDCGVAVFAFESRVKTIKSLEEKLRRPDKLAKYEKLEQITDLCGLRIVAFDTTDCGKLIASIRRELIVDETNSVNKSLTIDEDRFGYAGTHLILSLSEQRTKLFEYRGLGGLSAEIQIKTVLQHAWSVLDWTMRYKAEVEVPRELRRKLFRVSALLEAADEAFSEVKSQSYQIAEAYKSEFKDKRYDVQVNRDSLEAYLRASTNFQRILAICDQEQLPYEIADLDLDGPLSYLINSLRLAGIDSIEKLDNVLLKVGDDEVRLVKKVTEIGIGIGRLGPYTLLRDLILSASDFLTRINVLNNTPPQNKISAEEQVFLGR